MESIQLSRLKTAVKQIKEARVPLTLDVSFNKIGGVGAEFFAETIKEALALFTLYLQDNEIGEAGAKLFAEAIKEAQVSLTLYLYDNEIGEAGAKFLATSIKEARFPLTLHLYNNVIVEAGVKALAEVIKEAQVPLILDLGGNGIGEIGAKFFAQSIKEALAPITLNLSWNKIGEAGVKALAEAIKEARAPVTFYLHDNKIGEAGATLFAQSIREARVPVTLYLYDNRIGEAGTKLLAQSLKEARVPIALDLIFDETPLATRCGEFLSCAQEDNFIIDARSNPLTFFSRIEFSLSMRMIDQALGFPSVLAKLVQDYIGDKDLAWIDVAAIRACDGASHENKYLSINYELLDAIYFPKGGVEVAPDSAPDGEQMADDDQEDRRVSSSSSSSLQSQVLNLLLLLSRIKALSNKLETPQGYVDVPGDGLCFYHAIASQLGSNSYSALELQQMAINEIINHLDRYEGFAAQYGGGLDGFLNYHLQRQDSEKGGWADNIMIQALANALERVIEVQLFDRAGNAIGAGLVVINPHHVANPNALRLGNIEDLHFIAAEEVISSSTSLEEEQAPVVTLKRKRDFAENSKTHKAARTIQEDEVDAPKEDEGDPCEEEIDWDQYRCEVQDDGSVITPISESAPTPNATSQVYYEILEFGDASSFEFRPALMLSGMDSAISPI
jgi:hypothetical protein